MKKYFFITLIAHIIFHPLFSQVENLVEISMHVPHVKYNLKYANKNNFTSKRIYPKSTHQTFMVKDAVMALRNIAEELEKNDLGLLVWDAYRPFKATVKFWNLIHDERYVANPAKGSGHNRGIAIDLTLYKLSTGKLIEMPTGFDNFSDTAHHDFMAISQSKIDNRDFLKEIMYKYGFQSLQTEWWHYMWSNDRNYQILDIPFKKLKYK